MKIEMTGLLISRMDNPCSIEGCEKAPGADTAVWMLHPGREQLNVCLPHLKEKLESGEWEISTFAKGGVA